MNLIEKQQRIILNIKILDSLLEVYNEIVGRMDASIVSMAFLQYNGTILVYKMLLFKKNIYCFELSLILNTYRVLISTAKVQNT